MASSDMVRARKGWVGVDEPVDWRIPVGVVSGTATDVSGDMTGRIFVEAGTEGDGEVNSSINGPLYAL